MASQGTGKTKYEHLLFFLFFKYSCICVVQSSLKYLMPKLLSSHASFLFKECVCCLNDSNLVAATVNGWRFAFVWKATCQALPKHKRAQTLASAMQIPSSFEIWMNISIPVLAFVWLNPNPVTECLDEVV